MLPRKRPGTDGGGLHSAPILAPRPVGEALHRAQWEGTIAGDILDAIEPLAMSLVVVLAWSRSSIPATVLCARRGAGNRASDRQAGLAGRALARAAARRERK